MEIKVIGFPRATFFPSTDEITWVFDDTTPFTHVLFYGQPILTDLPVDLPPERVVGMTDVPCPQFSEAFMAFVTSGRVGRYFVGDTRGLPGLPVFVERPSLLPFSLPSQPIREKNEIMSVVVPDLRPEKPTPGYIYIHRILDSLLKNHIPVDVYGATALLQPGVDLSSTRIKGSISNDPLSPFRNYAFTISVEEQPTPYFYSVNKVVDPLCSGCIPLYCGCEQIDRYIDSLILLTGNLAQDMQTIVKVLNNPNKYYKEIDMVALDRQVDLAKRCAIGAGQYLRR